MPSPFVLKSNKVLSVLILLVPLLFSLSGYAQESTGSVIGLVSDSSGAKVDGATVTIKNEGTHETRQMVTANGQYAFTTLKLGTYSVTIVAAGFKKEHTAPFAIAAGDSRRVDVALAVGGNSETVEVSAASMLLKTDSSSIDISVPRGAGAGSRRRGYCR
jgi:hypothetical protein